MGPYTYGARVGMCLGLGLRDGLGGLHTSLWQERSRKTSTSALLTMPKPLSVWITTNCGKLWKRWECQTPELPLEKSVCRSRTNMEQETGFKLGKEYIKAVYCHPAYLTAMQSASWETLGGIKHKLESRLLGEISIASDMQITPPLWQKVKMN